MYNRAVVPPAPLTEEEKEQQKLKQQIKEEDSLARQAWLTLPYTKLFLTFLRQKEQDFMVAARDGVSNHGVTDGTTRNLVRSQQIGEIIKYAITGIN